MGKEQWWNVDWQGKTKVFEYKPALVTVPSPRMSYTVAQDRFLFFAGRSQQEA